MTTPTATDLRVGIRWIVRRDFPEVLAIDTASFVTPWTEADYLQQLRQKNIIGLVAEIGERVVGQVVYQLQPDMMDLIRLAVDPAHRSQGVGRRLVGKLLDKLAHHRRTAIDLLIRERNVHGQRFFAAQGFRAVGVERAWYDDTGEDAYVMQYVLDWGYRP